MSPKAGFPRRKRFPAILGGGCLAAVLIFMGTVACHTSIRKSLDSVPGIKALIADSLRHAQRVISWKGQGDTIIVFHGGKASSFAFFSEGRDGEGLFTQVEGKGGPCDTIPATAAIYPYCPDISVMASQDGQSFIVRGIYLPPVQKYPGGTHPLLAVDTSSVAPLPDSLIFTNILSTVRIPVTGSSRLRKAELMSRDSRHLFGEAILTVNMKDGPRTDLMIASPLSHGSPLTLDFGEEGLQLSRDTTYLEFSIPCGEYQNGFSVKLFEDSRRWMEKEFREGVTLDLDAEGATLGSTHYFPTVSPARTLVLSFSPEGSIGKIARSIAERTGADFFEILPEVPYQPKDYKEGDTSSRVHGEQEGTLPTPAFLGGTVPLEGYEKIFIATPIWWDSIPRILYPILGDGDMAGRTVIPFYTGGSASVSEQNVTRYLSSLCPLSPMMEARRFEGVPSDKDLEAWLSSLGMHFGGDDFMYMEIGEGDISAIRLGESALADSFRDALPLTLTLRGDGSGTSLSGKLDKDIHGDAEAPSTLRGGDLLLDGSDAVVVFLGKDSPNTRSLKKIGQLDSDAMKSLSSLPGEGVSVTLTPKAPLRVVWANDQVTFPALPSANYSGLAWTGGNRYILVDDKSASEGWREVSMSFDVNGQIVDISPGRLVSNTGTGKVDNEGIAFVPSRNSVFLTRESGNRILEFSPDGKPTGTSLPTGMFPSNGNAGLESLSYNPVTKLFYSTTEGTLPSQDTHRIQAWGADLKEKGHWLYRMDPAQAPSPHGSTYAFGISDVCALDDGRLLVMEREADVHTSLRSVLNSRTYIKVYVVDPTRSPEGEVLPKTIVARWTTSLASLANYEGMCLGPRRMDGKRVVIFVSDGQATLPDYFRTLVLD